MSSFSRRVCLVAALYFIGASAFPMLPRNPPWSFTLYQGTDCSGNSSLYEGTGGTGCRADLIDVAPAYMLHSQIGDGCRIEFFDNTMCDSYEITDIAGPRNPTDMCKAPGRHVGSYQVSCD
ncbi:hypothetical protein N7510_001108 [Penicillium lagena]|uniref:uncharacterized protein n=1 Tax=Penicillium lagena TaxID=94218 RepID=UPI002542092A|nr:uncharacterized protein N7510_001108 [Penicillium lagena]KAJ5624799.1 hypothetical protein N7510_001108 [Penicillium lagena]